MTKSILICMFIAVWANVSAASPAIQSSNSLAIDRNQIQFLASDRYKYGSIGTDHRASPPFKVWKVLPDLCPDLLPDRGGEGFENFGLIFEPGQEVPVGFSLASHSRAPLERIGANCASCHTSTFRDTQSSEPVVVLGMAAHRFDVMGYGRFLLQCASDSELFNFRSIRQALRQRGDSLNIRESVALRGLVPVMRSGARDFLERFDRFQNFQPLSGMGRDDSVNPYKVLYLDAEEIPEDEVVANVKFMSVFNGHLTADMWTHWDGSVLEPQARNALINLGTTSKESLRLVRNYMTSMEPERKWISEFLAQTQSPPYPREVNPAVIGNQGRDSGEALYNSNCSSCHGTLAERQGQAISPQSRVGEIVSLAEIGTDTMRHDALTEEFVVGMSPFILQLTDVASVRKSIGYRNSYLDGAFLRAPYLHNGSVPTLLDLLNHPDERPTTFYKGSDILDHQRLGFISSHQQMQSAGVDFRSLELFDTRLPGNNNGGHLYGTELSDSDKRAIVEYMKLF